MSMKKMAWIQGGTGTRVLSSGSKLKLETEQVSEILAFSSTMTQLIIQEDFSIFMCMEFFLQLGILIMETRWQECIQDRVSCMLITECEEKCEGFGHKAFSFS